jgi:cobalt/nickel transport protein
MRAGRLDTAFASQTRLEEEERKMRKLFLLVLISLCILFLPLIALAHFGMLIPSDSMVMQDDNRTINLKLSFSHPFEGQGMELVKPAVFGVTGKG